MIKIELTPRFKRDLRELAKRFCSIRLDIQPLIQKLQIGELPEDRLLGDKIKDVKHQVFKVCLKNSDMKKGKSGG